MKASISAKRPPAGFIEQRTSPKTRPVEGEIYRAWIPTRAKDPREPESQHLIVRVERIEQGRSDTEVILTAPDGDQIFPPFKTEVVPLRAWNPTGIFIPVESL